MYFLVECEYCQAVLLLVSLHFSILDDTCQSAAGIGSGKFSFFHFNSKTVMILQSGLFFIDAAVILALEPLGMTIYIAQYVTFECLPTVHRRGRTQECSKVLVVLLTFYWIKVSQLRFIFVFYMYIYI